jgi:uncharacterized protein
MKRLLTFLLSLFILPVFSQNIEIGKSFINSLLIEKDYSKSYSYFDEMIKNKISETKLKETVEQLEGQLGKYKSTIETNNEGLKFYYHSEFEKTKLDIILNFNDNNKINGFFFVPHKEFQKETSIGQDFNIKSNDIDLKGTLLIPEKDNTKNLVLLVHGSGASDKNENIAGNKPFKDIAEGLYAKGIASYRFDKRTFSDPKSFTNKSTIDDEVTHDVLNIIAYFKNNPQYKDYQITVIGHSLGAHLAPKIANKSNQISKIILLAGNARPLQELIVEQYGYLNQLNPSKEMEAEIAKLKEKVALLTSKDFNLDLPKEKLPLNLNAYYWKSLLDYKPLEEVKRVKIPMLILQGERDYQVTLKDFESWKNTLKNNKKVSFISYPKLNHLFMAGEGTPSPNDYLVKGTVDAKVINDIFDFVIKK